MRKIDPSYRSLDSRSVWLLLIPGFNIFWHFYLVIQIAKSYRRQIKHCGVTPKEAPTDIMIGVAIFTFNAAHFTLIFLSMVLPDLMAESIVMRAVAVIICIWVVIINPLLILCHLAECFRLRRYLQR